MDATKGAEDEEDGCVGAACVDCAGGIGDGNATRCTSGGVDRVVACAIMRNESEAWREDVDEFLVESACNLVQRVLSIT